MIKIFIVALVFTGLVSAAQLDGQLLPIQIAHRRGGSHPEVIRSLKYSVVKLNHGEKKAYVDNRGKFKIQGISDGEYYVSVENKYIKYPSYFLKVSNGALNLFSFNTTSNVKTRMANTQGYLAISPEGQKAYFDIKKPFDPMSILKSPMGMMLGVTVMMMMCMKNMPSPEEMRAAENARGQEEQK